MHFLNMYLLVVNRSSFVMHDSLRAVVYKYIIRTLVYCLIKYSQ